MPPALFLPSILPCPGHDLCTHHKSLFGPSPTPTTSPPTWPCPTCQKPHKTSYQPQSHSTYPPSQPATPTPLEALPTELLLHILAFLPLAESPYLALSSKTLAAKLGTRGSNSKATSRSTPALLQRLARDAPAYAPCTPCQVLRPQASDFAWGLLGPARRRERGVPGSVYGASAFLGWRVGAHARFGGAGAAETCGELLACEGVFRKSVGSEEERGLLLRVGFSAEELEGGLGIGFKAEGRVRGYGGERRGGDDDGVADVFVRVRYRLGLPKRWADMRIAERFAVLRDWYLCPHTYASKVQCREPDDTTGPTLSSMGNGEAREKTGRESTWQCGECTAEFRGRFDCSEDGRGEVIFDVWLELGGPCSDGMKEDVLCQQARFGNGSKGFGRIKMAFERSGK